MKTILVKNTFKEDKKFIDSLQNKLIGCRVITPDDLYVYDNIYFLVIWFEVCNYLHIFSNLKLTAHIAGYVGENTQGD